MKHIFITFATKDQHNVDGHHKNIHDAGLRIQQQAKDINLFDECILYTEEFLRENTDFWDTHKEFIKKHKKGYGFYIWKPYVIKKTMEKMNNGDILLYLDAGCEIDSTKANEMKKLIEKVKIEKIVGGGTGMPEGQFTKKKLFIKLGLYTEEHMHSMQRQGGTNFFLVCDETIKFVNEWYNLCCDYENIDESRHNLPQKDITNILFHQHRHDQSIFSLLTKKYKIFSFGISENSSISVKRNRTGNSNIINKQYSKTNINTIMKPISNIKVLENVRCSHEFWQIQNITLSQAIEKAKEDPNVIALHWFKKNGGDGSIDNINGWYQGAGGDIGVIKNNDWDTIVIKDLL